MRYLFLIFLFFANRLPAQLNVNKNFTPHKLDTIPGDGYEFWSNLNKSRRYFFVSTDSLGGLKVDTVRPKGMYLPELTIDSLGEFSGDNRGEWGGDLSFKGKNEKNYKKVTDGNIVSIFTYKNGIYYTEGLAHLSLNYGGLYRLKKHGNSFKADKVIDLGGEPEAYTMHNDTIYIVCLNKLVLIKDDKLLKEIPGNNWFWVYPNSIAYVDAEHVYIGHRAGYSVVNTITGKSVLYEYKKQ